MIKISTVFVICMVHILAIDSYQSCLKSNFGFDGKACVDCSKVTEPSLACKCVNSICTIKKVEQGDYDSSPYNCFALNSATPYEFGFFNRCFSCLSSYSRTSSRTGCQRNGLSGSEGFPENYGQKSQTICQRFLSDSVIFDYSQNPPVCFDCGQYQFQTQSACMINNQCNWLNNECIAVTSSTPRSQKSCSVIGPNYFYYPLLNNCADCSYYNEQSCNVMNQYCTYSNLKCQLKGTSSTPPPPPVDLPTDYTQCNALGSNFSFQIDLASPICIKCTTALSGNDISKPCFSENLGKTLGDPSYNTKENCEKVKYFSFNYSTNKCSTCYSSNQNGQQICEAEIQCQTEIAQNQQISCVGTRVNSNNLYDQLQCTYFGNYALSQQQKTCISCANLSNSQCASTPNCIFISNCEAIKVNQVKTLAECESMGITYRFWFGNQNVCLRCQALNEAACSLIQGCIWQFTFNESQCIGRTFKMAKSQLDCEQFGKLYQYSQENNTCFECSSYGKSDCPFPCAVLGSTCQDQVIISENCHLIGLDYIQVIRKHKVMCQNCNAYTESECLAESKCYWINLTSLCVKNKPYHVNCNLYTEQEYCSYVYLNISLENQKVEYCLWNNQQCTRYACSQYTSKQNCDQIYEKLCSWNQSENTCEVLDCSSITNMVECNMHLQSKLNSENFCQWKQSCVPINTVHCGYFINMNYCNEQTKAFGCLWIHETQKCKQFYSCSEIQSQAECRFFTSANFINNENCFWSNNSCNTFLPTTECYQLQDAEQCQSKTLPNGLKCLGNFIKESEEIKLENCENLKCSNLNVQECSNKPYSLECFWDTTNSKNPSCVQNKCSQLSEQDCKQYSYEGKLEFNGQHCFWNIKNECETVPLIQYVNCNLINDKDTCNGKNLYGQNCVWAPSQANQQESCLQILSCYDIIDPQTCINTNKYGNGIGCDYNIENKCVDIFKPVNCPSITNNYVCDLWDECIYDFKRSECRNNNCKTTDGLLCLQMTGCMWSDTFNSCQISPKQKQQLRPYQNPDPSISHQYTIVFTFLIFYLSI